MHLPGPVRAAVGLAASAADEARRLPDLAIELPMLAVSTALQASLRMQQRYARLAARGEEVLNRRAPTEEPPAWATFDEPVPVDELRSVLNGPDGADGADLAAGTDEKRAADTTAATKRPAKRAPAKKAAKKTTAGKPAARKTAAKTTAAKRSGAGSDAKRVSAPRHTTPSAFDAVGDPGGEQAGEPPAGT